MVDPLSDHAVLKRGHVLGIGLLDRAGLGQSVVAWWGGAVLVRGDHGDVVVLVDPYARVRRVRQRPRTKVRYRAEHQFCRAGEGE